MPGADQCWHGFRCGRTPRTRWAWCFFSASSTRPLVYSVDSSHQRLHVNLWIYGSNLLWAPLVSMLKHVVQTRLLTLRSWHFSLWPLWVLLDRRSRCKNGFNTDWLECLVMRFCGCFLLLLIMWYNGYCPRCHCSYFRLLLLLWFHFRWHARTFRFVQGLNTEGFLTINIVELSYINPLMYFFQIIWYTFITKCEYSLRLHNQFLVFNKKMDTLC